MPAIFAPRSKPQVSSKPPVAPIISAEADRAIFAILKRYGFMAFTLAVLSMAFDIILSSRYPHDKLFRQGGLIYDISVVAWLIPFYVGQTKQSALRLDFGRKYLAEARWKEAAAALGSFAEFGQKSFDRTGEAHYLLAQALDRTGKKERAEKARQFVTKYRSGTPWAEKLESVARNSAPTSAAQVRRKSIDPTGELVGRKPAAAQSKGKRRRF